MSSFQLNNGSIKRTSSHPTLDADLHLNPSFGYLGGALRTVFNEGIALFSGLKFGKRGEDYKIYFRASPESTQVTFTASSYAKVGVSCEYEIFGDEENRHSRNLFGISVLRFCLIVLLERSTNTKSTNGTRQSCKQWISR